MAEPVLTSEVQDNLKELVQLIRITKDSGGFFLVGVSGPAVKKIISEELSLRLRDELSIKKVKWKPGTKDLNELFPPGDNPNTIYIVDEVEKSVISDDGAAVFSLLNFTREFYIRNKKIVIYYLPAEVIYKKLQWKAADFWSFRVASFDFSVEEDYTAAIPEQGYQTAKVVLVGESGVGKSGLAYRLIEDQFIQTESTHGMKVWRLDLPIEEEKGLDREALLWDLAGQEDYRLVHQLYLEDTALALVLFNPQNPDPFAGVKDWLNALDAAAKNQPAPPVKLLVAARTDVESITVSRKKIDRFMEEYGFAAYLATSAKTGLNCSDSQNDNQPSVLKQSIAHHIPWSILPWTSMPRLLRELKNAVLVMKEEKLGLAGIPVLFQRLKQELPREVFGEDDVRTAVSLLANHGLVMPLKFGGLVLLQPELLSGYAAAVIRAARANIDEIGSVSQEDVFQRRIDMTGVTHLPQIEEDLLLRTLVQTFIDKSLCIAEDNDKGKQLIFPSQYRRERD